MLITLPFVLGINGEVSGKSCLEDKLILYTPLSHPTYPIPPYVSTAMQPEGMVCSSSGSMELGCGGRTTFFS